MALGDGPIDMAVTLRQCLETALAARVNPPADTCLYTGADFRSFLSAGLTEDRCCSGFAAVRIARIIPFTPAEGQMDGCGIKTWQVDLEMGVARCAPVGDINAGPTCAQLEAVAEQVQSDMQGMVEAVCCLRPFVVSNRVAPRTWEPFGPEGACTGGIMPVQLLLDACGCVS